MSKFCLLICLTVSAGATQTPKRQASETASLATIPIHMYSNDCGKHRAIPVALHQQARSNVPGAGIDATAGAFVLKDGFFQVACVKDLLFTNGDKVGKPHEYTLGDVSNVSIVNYNDVVAEDQQVEMTHETCFEFCRTVPDMLYFGLIHGRDCYCAPYFKPLADDSSDCDQVCAAKPFQMCGGKTKSLIFEMHQCADTKGNLQAAGSKGGDVADALKAVLNDVQTLAQDMQSGGQQLQDQFGKAGDPNAADLFQRAKEFAGRLQHASENEAKLLAELGAAIDESTKLVHANFKDSAANGRAEELTTHMEKLSTDAEDAVEELDALSELASPVDKNLEGSPSNLYYSLMYFVHKKFEDVPSTCNGDLDKEPMVGVSVDECANACDKNVLTCVGYSYYPQDKFCFLFSRFETVTYYTGCGGGAGFLQQDKRSHLKTTAITQPTCFAKLSEFKGTTLAPDPSGKCAGCLKEATKAARCYK